MRVFIISFLALLLFPGMSFAGNDACKGVPLDDREYYRIHAEQGDKEAQVKLGQIYLLRRTPEYNEKAIELFRKAAEQGYIPAYAALGRVYNEGIGAQQDFTESYYWYVLSKPSTRPSISEIIARKLSDTQRNEQNERIKEWRATHKEEWPRDRVGADENSLPDAFLNIDGILCGGESNGCKMVDNCGDMAAIDCAGHGLYFVSRITKETLNLCPFQSKDAGKSCQNGPLKGWQCEWPKTSRIRNGLLSSKFPLFSGMCKKITAAAVPGDSQERRDSIERWDSICDHSPSYDIVATCGDLIFLDQYSSGAADSSTFFGDMRKRELRLCGIWGGSCAPPTEWNCDWPPYFPDAPYQNLFRHPK